MENYINIILTLFLIGIYWYNTKAQNEKIKAPSEIIIDLKEHVKFFDLQKIKEYVELRETQKDKVLEVTREAIEKQFELKAQQLDNDSKKKNGDPIISNKAAEKVAQPYIYVIKELLFKSPEEVDRIINSYFPGNRDFVYSILDRAKDTMVKAYGVSSFDEVLKKVDVASFELGVTKRYRG